LPLFVKRVCLPAARGPTFAGFFMLGLPYLFPNSGETWIFHQVEARFFFPQARSAPFFRFGVFTIDWLAVSGSIFRDRNPPAVSV